MKEVLTIECGHLQAAEVRGSRAQTVTNAQIPRSEVGLVRALYLCKANFDLTHIPERAVADCYHGPSYHHSYRLENLPKTHDPPRRGK